MKKLTLAVVCGLSVLAHADDSIETMNSASFVKTEVIQTGRYTKVKNEPTDSQLNPLKVVIKTKIPKSAETVGQGMEFLLARSGFDLASVSVLSKEARALLSLPFPEFTATLGGVKS